MVELKTSCSNILKKEECITFIINESIKTW